MVVKAATKLEREKFEKKRKRREEVQIEYVTNGKRKKLILSCRTPHDQILPSSIDDIGHTNRIYAGKRKRSSAPTMDNSDTQRSRAQGTESADIHQLRSI